MFFFTIFKMFNFPKNILLAISITIFLTCIVQKVQCRDSDFDHHPHDRETESEIKSKIEQHFYKIQQINFSAPNSRESQENFNSITIHPFGDKDILKKHAKPAPRKNKVVLNQCADHVLKSYIKRRSESQFDLENENLPNLAPPKKIDYWAVPDWLKGPKSDYRSKQLNQVDYFNGALFKFQVATKPVNCSANFEMYEVRMADVYRNVSYDIDWQYGGYSDYFTPFGEFKMGQYFLDPDSFCVRSYNGHQGNNENIAITLEVCIPPTKIRKCCPYGTVVKFGLSSESELPTCVEILGEDWAPFYYKNGVTGNVVVEDVSYFSELFNPECTVYDKLTPNRLAKGPYLSDIKVLADGTVLTRSSGNHRWDKPKVYGDTYIKDFCIDGFLNSDQMVNENVETDGPLDFERLPENQILLFCHQRRKEMPESTVYSWLYFFLFAFSSMVLGVIVLVYVLLWKKQNIHGWTTLGFTSSMFFWFIFSAVAHGTGLFQGNGWGIEVGGAACILNGILWHFFYVATFSWMAVLNYDLWSTTCTPTTPTTAQRSNINTKLRFYCCAGFGPPIIVVLIALIIEFNVDIFDDQIVRPMYGHDICCLDKTALLFYAFSVSSIFFILNLFFAGSTIVFLCKYRKKSKQCLAIQKELSHFGKLFILMGFTWIFEMASWNEELTWYWATFDVYNIIQAVGLFWIFVGRREVLEQLFAEYKIFGVLCKCIKQDQGKKLSETEKASQGYSQTYKGISMVTVGNALSTCIEMELGPTPKMSIDSAGNFNFTSEAVASTSADATAATASHSTQQKNVKAVSENNVEHIENHM